MAATLKAKATLDDRPFQNALKRMRNGAGAAGKAIGKGFKFAAVGGVGAMAAGTLLAARAGYKLTTSAVDNAAALHKLSRATGFTVKDLAALQDTFEENQMDLGQLSKTLGMMEKTLASMSADKLSDALQQIGLSAEEFAKASPAEKFIQISRGISQLEDPLKRAGAASLFFKRSGQELLPIMDDVAKLDLEALNKEAETLDKMSEGAREAKRAMTQAKDAVERFGVGVASKIIPLLTRASQAVAEMGDKFQSAGEKVGSVINDMAGAPAATEIAPMTSVGKDPFAGLRTAHSRKSDFLDYATARQQGLSDPSIPAPRGSLTSGGLQSGSLNGASMTMGTKGAAWGRIRRGDHARNKEQDRLKAIEELAKRQAEAAERTADAVEEVING